MFVSVRYETKWGLKIVKKKFLKMYYNTLRFTKILSNKWNNDGEWVKFGISVFDMKSNFDSDLQEVIKHIIWLLVLPRAISSREESAIRSEFNFLLKVLIPGRILWCIGIPRMETTVLGLRMPKLASQWSIWESIWKRFLSHVPHYVPYPRVTGTIHLTLCAFVL